MTDSTSLEQVWDAMYGEADRVWSGEPNGALVAEAEGLPPGAALDVGCGEGADAVWLALQGWEVTALDVSGVALARAEAAAVEAGVTVRWLHAGLLDAALPTAGFDLVVALYPVLLRSPDHEAERALLNAVGPLGTLVFVHHDVFGTPAAGNAIPPSQDGHAAGPHHGHGPEHDNDGRFSPADMVSVEDMRSFLAAQAEEWQIETHEQRPRRLSGGAGAQHSEDVVLRARRLA